MLVVFSALPQARSGHVIDEVVICNPYLGLVLTVPQRELRSCYEGKLFCGNHFILPFTARLPGWYGPALMLPARSTPVGMPWANLVEAGT